MRLSGVLSLFFAVWMGAGLGVAAAPPPVALQLLSRIGTWHALRPCGPQDLKRGAIEWPYFRTGYSATETACIQMCDEGKGQTVANRFGMPTCQRFDRALPAASQQARRARQQQLRGGLVGRADPASSTTAPCPSDKTACPLSTSLAGGYECVDTDDELTSCGTCGNDCTAIKGSDGVACLKGRCRVLSCTAGFTLHTPSNSCVRGHKSRRQPSRTQP